MRKVHQERYNLAPQQRMLIIRELDEGREAVMARWGLLPHWAKDTKVAFKMINARAPSRTSTKREPLTHKQTACTRLRLRAGTASSRGS